MSKAWALLGTLMLVAFAGCTDGGSDAPFTYKQGDTPGSFTFKSNVKADSYSWDFGDKVGHAEGPDAEYTYDFATGRVVAKLTVTRAGETETYAETIVIGEGENDAPALILEAGTNWTVVGETIRFSALNSVDSENDNLRFQWSCFVKQDTLERQAAHAHGGGGGVPFATPGAGSGLSRVALEPIGAPERVIDGDLCDGLGAVGWTRDAIIEGSFASDGLYQITLIGTDGPNPTVATTFDLYVSDPALRPPPVRQFVFNSTLLAGSGGGLQSFCTELEQICDEQFHSFTLDVNALSLTAELSYDGGAANQVSMFLMRGANAVAGPSSDVIAEASLKEGGYAMRVVLDQGANVGYTVTVTAEMDLTPTKYF